MSLLSSASGRESRENSAIDDRSAMIDDRCAKPSIVGDLVDDALPSATAMVLPESRAALDAGPLGFFPGMLPAVFLLDLLDPTAPQGAKRKPVEDEPEDEDAEEEDDLPEDEEEEDAEDEEEEEEEDDFDDEEEDEDEDDDEEDEDDEDEDEEDDFDNPDDDDDDYDDDEDDFDDEE